MARGGFNGDHFSFQSKQLSRKNSSNSKVKADALWEEQDTLIYGGWNRKCGLRMRMRNKITWLGWLYFSACLCNLVREGFRERLSPSGQLRLSFARKTEHVKAKMGKKKKGTL